MGGTGCTPTASGKDGIGIGLYVYQHAPCLQRKVNRPRNAAAGSLKSSAGTYTACTDVIAPAGVLQIRSSNSASSVASVG